MGRTAPAARLKPFALKFFFSNQYLYAHVQRRADGVVRRPTAHARASGKTACERMPLRSLTRRAHLWLQIVAAASTIEKTLRETMKSCTDVAAATKVGAWLCAANPRHFRRRLTRLLPQASCWRSAARLRALRVRAAERARVPAAFAGGCCSA
jgi:hypothetical protein